MPSGLKVPQCHTTRLNLGDGPRYNASLARDDKKWLLAYRHGMGGSNIRLATLDDDYHVLSDALLNLPHPLCKDSREDPRLFRWNGRWHIGFCGGEVNQRRLNAHQLIASLNDRLEPERIMAPSYVHRQWPMEKNWAWFEWMGELFCVYTISPHRILHFDGADVHNFSATQTVLPWRGGHLRGGASPVRVGDEYYHWFHGAWDGGRRTYNGGVYTFEARPPFRITRMTRDPVMLPPGGTSPSEGILSDVIFPAGASLLVSGTWFVSCGSQDFHSEVRVYDKMVIDDLLEPVT